MVARWLLGGVAVVFGLALIATVIANLTVLRTQQTIYVASRNIAAGETFSDQNLQAIHVYRGQDTLNLLSDPPYHRRSAHTLKAQDPIRRSDILSTSLVAIPVKFQQAPSLSRGDAVDVFVQVSNRTVKIGAGLIVTQVGGPSGGQGGQPGGQVTILVPAAEEPQWAAVSASNAPLLAAISLGVDTPGGADLSLPEAVQQLSRRAAGG